jgi:hypothetical protein
MVGGFSIQRISSIVLVFGIICASFAANSNLAFNIARSSSLPQLTYKDITLKVNACGATSASVTVDGSAVTSTVTGGNVVFNTAGNSAVVTLFDPTATGSLGAFTKAALKYDRSFALSMGFDDGQMLNETFAAVNAKGYRGTVFVMNKDGNSFSLTRNESSWICDCPQLKVLVGQGWAPGNHSYSHSSTGSEADVLQMQDLLHQCLSSSYPNYIIIAFAAPMFDGSWQPVINSIRTSKSATLLFNESGNDYKIRVDAGQPAVSGWLAFSPTMTIGRNPALESGLSAVQADIDWMNTNADATHHYWYNLLAHGNNQADVPAVVNYCYSTYGAGGSNKIWVAPSDEIYSYLLVRDNCTVTYSSSTDVRYNMHASAMNTEQIGISVTGRTISNTTGLPTIQIFDTKGRMVAAGAAGFVWNAPSAGMYYVKASDFTKLVMNN